MRSSADKWDIPFQPTSKKRQAAIYVLEAGQPVSRDDIADHADLPKSTVTEVIKDLVKAGYTVSRETDAYRRAWYEVIAQHDAHAAAANNGTTKTRTFPRRTRDVAADIDMDEPVGGAVLTVPVAPAAPPVQFKGFADGEIELTWEDAPGVLFRGTVGDSVPGALLSGNSQVEKVSVHPSGAITLDLGFMQVRGSLR